MNKETSLLGAQDHELLQLLSQGSENRAIAHELNKSEFTVRNQLSRLYRKIKVANRDHAAVWFTENAPLLGALPAPRPAVPWKTLSNRYICTIAGSALMFKNELPSAGNRR